MSVRFSSQMVGRAARGPLQSGAGGRGVACVLGRCRAVLLLLRHLKRGNDRGPNLSFASPRQRKHRAVEPIARDVRGHHLVGAPRRRSTSETPPSIRGIIVAWVAHV